MLYKNFKKITLVILALIFSITIISPYLITFYVTYKFNKLSRKIEKFIPGIKINNYLEQGYSKSLLISEIKFFDNAFIINNNIADDQAHVYNNSNYTLNKTIILENHIRSFPFTYGIVKINTGFLSGAPKFIKNQTKIKILTDLNFKEKINILFENLDINHLIEANVNNFIIANKAKICLTNENNNLQIDFNIPKLLYQENVNKVEIEDLHFNFKIRNYLDHNKIKAKFLTEIDQLRLFYKAKPILKLSNLNIEQRLSDQLSNKITFLKLNILNNKFGPLTTKLQINNISLVKLNENFLDFKFPINTSKLNLNNTINLINSLLKYKPNILNDWLLYVGSEKINVLSDCIVEHQYDDFLDLNEILDALNLNVYAKIPKKVAVNLIASLLELKEYGKSNIARNELNNLVAEKIQYLLNHNIIKEEDNDFLLDLAISQGTFYSRINPFKIFSF